MSQGQPKPVGRIAAERQCGQMAASAATRSPWKRSARRRALPDPRARPAVSALAAGRIPEEP
eukprot:7608834-Lingulodinium_polyedra.AAC.1